MMRVTMSCLALFLVACSPSQDKGPTPAGAGGGAGGAGPIVGTVRMDLAGHALASHPSFRVAQSFNDDEGVAIAVRGSSAKRCDVYVVSAKSDAGWLADAALHDVRGQSQSIALDPLTIVEIAAPGELSSDAGAGLGVGYDVVLDCDADGQLGPGDMIDGGDRAGLYRTHDTTRPGPLAIAIVDHDGGSFRKQRVFFPADIAGMGAPPLVVVTHGWSYTHTYYDYIGEHLASYGYVVMAHEAEVGQGGPEGTLTAAVTTLDNTHHLLDNLDSIAGGVLAGHIDAERIMFTGHSTGGEAVVRAVTMLRDVSFSSPHFDLESIELVSSMAPVSWHSRAVVDPGDVNFHMFVAGADDDVSGAPEPSYTQCLSIYERARGERQLTYIHGAGHGDLLSCCGERFVDENAPALIGRDATVEVARGYFLPLAELYLRDNPAARDFFIRSYDDFHPQGIAPQVTITNEHRAADATVLDDFQSESGLDRSSAGGLVTFDVGDAAEILMQDNDGSLAWTGDQPSNGMTRARHAGDDPHAVVFGWTSDAFYEQTVPAQLSDFGPFEALSFRVCQGTRHPETVALGGPLSFAVTLRDVHGAESTLRTDEIAPIAAPYQRAGFGAGAGWQNELVSVRLRLRDFGGVDLGAIRAVRFDFGPSFDSPRGRIGLDDIELVRE